MKSLSKVLLIGAGVLTAVAPTVTIANQTTIVERHVINQMSIAKPKYSIKYYCGGLPLVTEFTGSSFGLTPKEYGLRYGNGKSRKSKVNKKHRSHLMKIKTK